MNNVNGALTNEQKTNAIHRLTALWAFTESGLGGIMHALQIPFTGLLVGGMAVIMICLIAGFSEHRYKQILKSTLIVVIVKAMVSPHTPFSAYIAVSFQALLAYALFSLLKVNFFSIVLLSIIAMIESAIQKLITLTIFFSKSIWAALDDMVAFAVKQFGGSITNGSHWIVSVYLLIYIIGGLLIAWLAYHTVKSINTANIAFVLNQQLQKKKLLPQIKKSNTKRFFKKLVVLITIMFSLSVILFVFADDTKKGWLAVAKTLTWTLSAILIWFLLISPLLTKAIQKILKKKQNRYSDEVLKILSFIPVLKQLTLLAWQLSEQKSGPGRLFLFFTTLIHYTLTYSEPSLKLKDNITL